MVVDDTSEVQRAIKSVLQLLGHWNVVTASGGQECIEKATADPPDAIILDVQMPQMDGPSTLRKLQENERTRSIPVVFLTAKADTGDLLPYLDLGAKGILNKPFEPMNLVSEVAKLLGEAWPPRDDTSGPRRVRSRS